MTVYNSYNRTVAFEGSYQECLDFMFNQADSLGNGAKLYRTWTDENGDTFYDVGRVYIFNGKPEKNTKN